MEQTELQKHNLGHDGERQHRKVIEELEESLQRVKNENRSLKIKIAGVDTLSSLLNGTRDELDTVFAEKESLEIEIATLQCRCSMLENDLAERKANLEASKSSKCVLEALVKENKQLKNELKQAKKNKPSTEGLFDPDTMFELLAFKGEVEMEIKNIQKVMHSQEDESQITQISRLLGQVAKLEHNLSRKEEECNSLRSEMVVLKKDQASHCHSNDAIVQGPAYVADAAVQTDLVNDIKEVSTTHQNNQANESVNGSSMKPKRSSSLKRRNSKRASGDWTNIRKSHSDLFEESWNIDNINPTENLKVTQDLLVQANEIIMIMTEENDKLLKVNAVLLEELTKTSNDCDSEKQGSVKERLMFLFSELSFENGAEDDEAMQNLLISSLSDAPKTSNQLETIVDNNNITNESSNLLSKETSSKKNAHTRDSGVDIFHLEPNQCCTAQTGIHTVIENKESQVEVKSNDSLESDPTGNKQENTSLKLLEEGCKKLAEAEIKISQLQKQISVLEEKEKKSEKYEAVLKTRHSGKRLCKSVSNIPSSVHLPVTYQRIVLESDI